MAIDRTRAPSRNGPSAFAMNEARRQIASFVRATDEWYASHSRSIGRVSGVADLAGRMSEEERPAAADTHHQRPWEPSTRHAGFGSIPAVDIGAASFSPDENDATRCQNRQQ